MASSTDTGPTATALDIIRVVVPFDGSSFAAAALPTARAVAERFGAELVTDEPSSAAPGTLVVSSTRARGRLHGALAGSDLDDRLADGAPFIAVGPNADRPGWLVGRPRRRSASWPEPLSKGHVVVLVDGTSDAEAAVPWAARWAVALDRELVVLTIAPAFTALYGEQDAAAPADLDAIAERARAATSGLRVRGELVADPLGVAAGVRRYLAAHEVALLVLACAPRRGLERLRRGATAATIVRTASVPTLVVPHHARGR